MPRTTTHDASQDTLAASKPSRRSSYGNPTGIRVFTSILYLISLAFLILVQIGTLNNNPVIRSTYLLRINLANIVPATVANAVLINTIAQSIGLHDFYQVGLWNYCAGEVNRGITTCSPPRTFYWFNPVEIITSELLAGATIALPTDLVNVLNIVRVASAWMFASFLVGAVFTAIAVFVAPVGFSGRSSWLQHRVRRIFVRQLPVTVVTLVALLFVAVGALIATIMFVIFRNTFENATELNIRAQLGPETLAFMWLAVALNLLGFIVQLGACCRVCCGSRGRKLIKREGEKSTVSPLVQKEARQP